ncbi:hypothetical protein MRX96_031151 [Rhipicephalus microplus]
MLVSSKRDQAIRDLPRSGALSSCYTRRRCLVHTRAPMASTGAPGKLTHNYIVLGTYECAQVGASELPMLDADVVLSFEELLGGGSDVALDLGSVRRKLWLLSGDEATQQGCNTPPATVLGEGQGVPRGSRRTSHKKRAERFGGWMNKR